MSTNALKKCEPYVRQQNMNSIAFVPAANKRLSQGRLTVASATRTQEQRNANWHGVCVKHTRHIAELVCGVLSSAPILLSYFTRVTKPAAREGKRAVRQAPLVTGVTFLQGGHVSFFTVIVVVDFAVVGASVANRRPAVVGAAVVAAGALVVAAQAAAQAAVCPLPWDIVTMAAKKTAVRTELAMTATRRSRINPNVCPKEMP